MVILAGKTESRIRMVNYQAFAVRFQAGTQTEQGKACVPVVSQM